MFISISVFTCRKAEAGSAPVGFFGRVHVVAHGDLGRVPQPAGDRAYGELLG